MEKSEYLELYKKWTNADSHKESAAISKEILDKSFEELKQIEEVYDYCGMSYESPCNSRLETIYIDQVSKIRLISLNSLEVTISAYCNYGSKWQDVILNVKYFGEKGRNLLKKTLLETAISEYNSRISESQSIIKSENEAIAEFTEKKSKLEEKLNSLKEQEDSEK